MKQKIAEEQKKNEPKESPEKKKEIEEEAVFQRQVTKLHPSIAKVMVKEREVKKKEEEEKKK